MKGKLALCCTVLLAALLIVGVALACEDPRPPAPTCPDGQIETSPAVWVEGTSTCPSVQFSASRTLYENDFVEYSAWGEWSPWATGNGQKCHGDGDLCEQRSQGSPKQYSHRHRTVVNEHACSVGYTYREQSGSNDCYRVETFGPIVVQYNKSSDPNHCHRPTGSSLGVPSWAMSEYNQLPELDAIVTAGYWLPPVCEAPIITEEPPIETEEPPVTEEPPIETEEPPVTEEPPTEEPPIPTPEPTPEPPEACLYTVTTYFQCNTGAAIWVQETGIYSGEGTNFVGYAPYNRECGFCDGITGIYHREWRSDCDGTGWDEGTWNMPEEFHELNGCPLGGRCVGQ